MAEDDQQYIQTHSLNMLDFTAKYHNNYLRKANSKQTELTDLFIHIDFYGFT